MTAKGDDIILPEGFHWDNEIPVVVRKFPMDNTSPICFTSIPTRRFLNNNVSYGQLLCTMQVQIKYIIQRTIIIQNNSNLLL